MSKRKEVWELVEEAEDKLVRVRGVLAFAFYYAAEHGHKDADSYHTALIEVDNIVYRLGYVRELLQNHAADVNVHSVDELVGSDAYARWVDSGRE